MPLRYPQIAENSVNAVKFAGCRCNIRSKTFFKYLKNSKLQKNDNRWKMTCIGFQNSRFRGLGDTTTSQKN